LWGWWQSTHAGSTCASFSHSSPLMTLRCTASIWAWHCVQVRAMLPRAIEEAGSVWGRMLCALWHEAQLGATTRPFFSRPSPWIDSE